MAAIGSLLFCTDCGNLLEPSNTSRDILITCDVCGALNKDSSNKTVTAHSKPSAFPSTLRQKHSAVREVRQEDMNTESVIKQTCPQCNREEMRYHTVQLRSADEGSTVFYSCECGYKFNTNN